jgi:hypothetical protein
VSRGPQVDYAVLCIYRSRNADRVSDMIEPLTAEGREICLWSLDQITDDRLAHWTVGSGPGARSALLNRLYSRLPDDFAGYIVVMDDDVTLRHSALKDFVQIVAYACLDLAQPAHSGRSAISHPVTLVRSPSLARLTRFVEIGPLFVAGPRIQHGIFPMDEQLGMGVGMDFVWSKLASDGFHLGIVDCVVMHHAGPIGTAYDSSDDVAGRLAEEAGGYSQVTRTLAYWRPWRRRPPWAPATAAQD